MQDRIFQLNQARPVDGQHVVYVMSRDQRLHDNHALLAAQQDALQQKLPLVIFFNVLPKTGFRAREHYQFMLEGLKELAENAKKFNISFIIKTGSAKENLHKLEKLLQPSAIYFDFSPLTGPRQLHQQFANTAPCPCYEVDTHNIIPARIASDHQEFAAHTFRSKVHARLAQYLLAPAKLVKHPYTSSVKIAHDWPDSKFLNTVPANHTRIAFISGETAASTQLQTFIHHGLASFAKERNNPIVDGTSNLSPYLHYGQISSLRVALEVLQNVKKDPLLFKEARLASAGETPSNEDGMNALFEEMIVRKELSDNFCFYAKSYTTFSSVPAWANNTLQKHTSDRREHTYTKKQWEEATTHDPAWNAAQIQLKKCGKIHGYMRMYWAKKLLEWSETPQDALETAIYLNDHYSIDGGDPNGYVGILWSIAGLHDRPWIERPVFGQIRYMNYEGLKRKFDIEQYCQKWTTEL